MNLLVTGGAGFIGSNFIHYWIKNNPQDKIINLDKITYAGNLENLAEIENNKNYCFVKGDICDYDLVNSLVSEVDIIIHFAAESHVDRSIKGSEDFVRTNIEGTRVLLDAAKDKGGVRFHHVSTDEVFGELSLGDEKFNENTAYDPRSPYSASKAASDHLVRAYFHTHKLPITISNCTNNYGPYQHLEKFISLVITNLLLNKKVPIYGSGENIRDWLYVKDHCCGIEAIIKKGKIGETYCLGGDNEITNIDVVSKILSLLEKDKEMIEYVDDRPGHDFRYAMDISRAKNELDWQPSVGFNEGLKKTVGWYKNNRAWWEKSK